MAISVTLLNTFYDYCQAKAGLISVAKFQERPTWPLLFGSLCHEIISGLHPTKKQTKDKRIEIIPPVYKSLDEALTMYGNKWGGIKLENMGIVKFSGGSLKLSDYLKELKKRGERGINYYYLENMVENRPFPYYNEAARTIKIELDGGFISVNIRIDQARTLEIHDAAKYRPELVDLEKGRLQHNYMPHIMIDLKFGEREEPYGGRHIEGNLYECKMDSLTDAERRQNTIYNMGYMWMHKVKRGKDKGKLKKRALGLVFYYPAQQIAGFAHPTQKHYKKIKSEVRNFLNVANNGAWKRVLEEDKCKNCCFLSDCRGFHDELVDVPLHALPSVLRGVPNWQLETGVHEGPLQIKMPF